MRFEARHDLLAAAGMLVAAIAWPLLGTPWASVIVGSFAVAVLVMVHARPSAPAPRLGRGWWRAPALSALVLLILFVGGWRAGGWRPQASFNGVEAALMGLVATVGVGLGVAAMTKPRPALVWASAPLVGCVVYVGSAALWAFALA